MLPPDAISALAALFIVAMVWLRTRMQYRKNAQGRRLTRAGLIYFAALVLLLVLGWFAAPAAARRLAAVPVAPTLARVVWFLAAYYLFIPLHRALQARGVAVFGSSAGQTL
jgi:hypothetical protein